MAYIGTGSTLTQKAWRSGLTHEAERQTYLMGFVSEDDTSGICLLEELTRQRGDTIQVRFSPTDDTHDGFSDADEIEGNEEQLSFITDEMKIDYLGFAYKQPGQMSQQRVNFDLKQAAFTKLGVRWSRRYEEWGFNQLACYTPAMGAGQNNFKRTGLNAVPTVDANHYLDPEGAGDDESITSSGPPTLDFLTEAVATLTSKATISYPLAPCPDGYYHWFIHTFQAKLLRENTTAGDWGDIFRAVLEGGKKYESSAHARGYMGVYNNVKIHVSDYIPLGVDSGDATLPVANVRRSVLMGSRAAHWAYGEGYASGDHLDWSEQVRSHKVWSVLADTVGGCKVTVFNNELYGSAVLSTYSEQ